jgi:hypothetical protein
VLASKCTSCHSDPPINGSLSGLVTYADLRATSKEDPSKNEAQLSVVRMQSGTSPMPPASLHNAASPSDIAAVQDWIAAGYPTESCAVDGGSAPDSGSSGSAVDVFGDQPPFTPGMGRATHNAGLDCMQCHGGGDKEGKSFMFGGTLYDGNGAAAAGAEVRVVDANGAGTSVYTGPTGTFYASGRRLATPGHAGARNATTKVLMISQLTRGGCGSCHCTGSGCTTAELHLP